MILFTENGNVQINSFESVEDYRAWEARARDAPMHIAHAMKMPETTAGVVLMNLCRMGIHDDDGFEVLLEGILGEAFRAGIAFAQEK